MRRDVQAVELDHRGTLRVIRTVIEVAGHASFKPFPKSAAGRCTVPMPAWLVTILREHLARYPLGEADLIFPTRSVARCGAPCSALACGGPR